MQVPQRVRAAAMRFLAAAFPDRDFDNMGWLERSISDAVFSAFLLNHLDWPGFGIRGWAWPFNQLEGGGDFSGDQTWAVLLRHAFDLANRSTENPGRRPQ